MRNSVDVYMGGYDEGKTPSVQQYDENSREYQLNLWVNEQTPYLLPEGAAVGVVYQPRGKNPTEEYKAEILTRSTALVRLPSAVTKKRGSVEMQLLIHTENGVLHSPVITFEVLRSLKPGEGEGGEPEKMLGELISEANTLMAAFEKQLSEDGFRGPPGPAGKIVKVNATIDGRVGKPTVSVGTGGTPEELELYLDFGSLKGAQGFSPVFSQGVNILPDGRKETHLYIQSQTGSQTVVIADGYTPKRGVDYWTEEDVRRFSGVLDAVASEHRHLIFGFENNEMKLCVSGSDDNGGTIQLLAQNIYQPQLGRKTLRDPSGVWYKGCLYLTYTIIDWASGSSNIGFCRTRDLMHFEELPQLPTNNSVYPNIPRCYAPAFCVIDGHIYIACAAVGEGGTFTNEFGETFDESVSAGWSVINRGNMMIHEYFPESHTLKFVGLLNGVPGIDVHLCKAKGQYYACGRNFKLYRSDNLLGPYELIWDGTEYSESGSEVWREGAYLLEKPDGTWRVFAHKPGKAYEYYDSLTDDLNDGFAAEMQTCAGDTSTAMHMTIMDTVTMEAAVREGRAYALTNLLHNADFTQMVAQAGVSAVHGGGSATFAGDRWELVNGTVTAAANINGNGYGNVTLNGSIRQKVENMPGTWTAGVVTLAGRAEASYENGWFTITSEGGVLDSAYLYAGEHTNAQKPVARGYAAELLECQRFYVRLEASGALSYHGYAFGTDVARIMIPLPVAMRKSDPAYKVTWTVNLTLYPGEITPSGISSVTVIGNYCAMALSASGLTPDTPLMAKGNATIELNCDLN